MEKKSILKSIGRVFIVLCVIFTLVVGSMLATNYQGIMKFVKVAGLVESQFLWEVNDDYLLEGALIGLVDSLGDDYSSYLTKEDVGELKSHLESVIGGIGVYVGVKDNKVTVISPVSGGPSEKAGIKAGDIIVEVDNQDVRNMNVDQIVNMMRGDMGTSVKIGVERAGNDGVLRFDVVRDIINIETVAGMMIDEQDKIGYIQITSFASNTDESFTKVMDELKGQGCKALIIDLRNNPGGDVESVSNIAKLLVPQGPIVHTVNNKGDMETITAPGGEFGGPIAVLVNGGSASASEILAGAIKDTNSGTIIGTQTFGKGIVQSVYFLKDGTGLKLTTAHYLTPNKNDIHGIGVEPDIIIDFDEESFSRSNPVHDNQIEKALNVIQEELAN